MRKYSKHDGDLWYHYHTFGEKGSRQIWLRLLGLCFHLQITTRYKHVGFRFHTGLRSSETPIDWNVCLYFISFYGSFDAPGLGRFCQWLGRGHKRNVSLQIHGGKLWWELWYDDDGGNDQYHKHDKWKKPILPPWRWGRKKYRSWMCLREGSIELNPLSAIWGSRVYHYTDVDTHISWVQMNKSDPDDLYLIEFTLQEQHQYRDHGPGWARGFKDRGYTVDWHSEKGVPTKRDGRGRIFGSGFGIERCQAPLWKNAAIDKMPMRIGEMRIREGYKPAKVS